MRELEKRDKFLFNLNMWIYVFYFSLDIFIENFE